MRKLHLYLITILLLGLPMLYSCDDSDGYSLDNFMEEMATVRIKNGNIYYLEIDNGKTLWPAASDIPWYEPLDGQRVIANFTLLGDDFQGYDYAVKVNYLWNVLTKGVEELTAENEAMYGNDPVTIITMQLGGNYLNIRFQIDIPAYTKHRVSLVQNTTVTPPDDGYVHLEYRYNDEDDVTGLIKQNFVSFNLGEYAPEAGIAAGYKGIKVKINSEIDGEKELIYDYNTNGDVDVNRTVHVTTDVVDGAR